MGRNFINTVASDGFCRSIRRGEKDIVEYAFVHDFVHEKSWKNGTFSKL